MKIITNIESKINKKFINSSSRGRKRVTKVAAANGNSKLPYQSSVCNSNTSRKTTAHNSKFINTSSKTNNSKFANSKNRLSRKLLNQSCNKFNEFKQPKVTKNKLPEMMQNIINIHTNINANTNIIKTINKKHKNMPKSGIHYRTKTTDIGKSGNLILGI